MKYYSVYSIYILQCIYAYMQQCIYILYCIYAYHAYVYKYIYAYRYTYICMCIYQQIYNARYNSYIITCKQMCQKTQLERKFFIFSEYSFICICINKSAFLFLCVYTHIKLGQFRKGLIIYIYFSQIQASECDISFGCFRKPENCIGADCEFLITYKATENMPEYVDISMTTTWQWIGLGHNIFPLMVKYATFKHHLKKLIPKSSNDT